MTNRRMAGAGLMHRDAAGESAAASGSDPDANEHELLLENGDALLIETGEELRLEQDA